MNNPLHLPFVVPLTALPPCETSWLWACMQVANHSEDINQEVKISHSALQAVDSVEDFRGCQIGHDLGHTLSGSPCSKSIKLTQHYL